MQIGTIQQLYSSPSHQIVESNKEVVQLLQQISEKLDTIVSELQPKEVTISSAMIAEEAINYIKSNKGLLRANNNEKRSKTLQIPLTAFKFKNPHIEGV